VAMTEWQGKITADPDKKKKQVRSASSRYAAKKAAEGLVRIAVWVPDLYADDLRDYAAALVQKEKDYTANLG
jgi:hypothetical protein